MDGEGARVVVLVGAEKRVLRAQMGDEIDGWKVVQIDGRKLVLSLNGRFVTFTLFNRDVDQRNLGDGTASKAGNASQPSLQQILSPANRNARN
jgi:general secretion pathway protein N